MQDYQDYLVTYDNYKPRVVEAFTKSEAAKAVKEGLESWGLNVTGKAKVELYIRAE